MQFLAVVCAANEHKRKFALEAAHGDGALRVRHSALERTRRLKDTASDTRKEHKREAVVVSMEVGNSNTHMAKHEESSSKHGY